VCDDGSIFVDRDGEHFGQVLECMRDGMVTVAEPGVRSSVSLLRALKREFGFYCIELLAEQEAEPEQLEVAYVMGGGEMGSRLASMERYDASSGQWSAVAAMGTARSRVGACVVAGELYVSGGHDGSNGLSSSVEKYTPSSDNWSAVAPLLTARSNHAAVVVGSAMYVLGGIVAGARVNEVSTSSVLKFDSMQDTWSQVAPMPVAIHSFAACAIGSDIYTFGGHGDGYQASVFDIETNTWSTLAPMPHACSFISASVLDGQVYIVGVDTSGRVVLCFDPTSAAWSALASTSSRRRCGVSFVLGGCQYAMGGFEGQQASGSVERYDVASNTWAYVANMLEQRSQFGAVIPISTDPTEEQDLFDSLIDRASNGCP
jgi:hypothetical protein